METKNCIICGRPAIFWTGNVYKNSQSILAGWCNVHEYKAEEGKNYGLYEEKHGISNEALHITAGNMKRLIDITDEDVISVINRIHILTENKVISRNGILGLDFKDSFKKYGSAYIEIEMVSNDTVTDGYYTIVSRCKMIFNHKSVWFAEIRCNGEDSNYNKNHFFGYLKLQELGYELPNKPQW